MTKGMADHVAFTRADVLVEVFYFWIKVHDLNDFIQQ